MSSIIELDDIKKNYGKGDSIVHALNGIDMTIQQGDMVAVMGVSGSGKSTLLNIIGLLTDPSSGTYTIDGNQVSSMNEKQKARARNSFFGFVVQDFALIEQFTVKQNLAVPFAYREHKLKTSQRNVRIHEILIKMGLSDKAKTRVNNLSGGQRQRVAIARALINDPEVILADEPTGALDSKTAEEIMGLLRSLNEEGKTIIIITHDKKVAGYCKRQAVISDGKLIIG